MALLSVAEARARLLAMFEPVGTETVRLAEAADRVLAEDIRAQRDQPPFAASAMDGYAVRAEDLRPGAQLRVTGTAPAGGSFEGPVGTGEAVRIFTGAPVPVGADVILIQEDAESDGDTITVQDGHDLGHHIRAAGSDFAAGATLEAPRRLTPRDLALLAAMNAPKLPVRRRPVVALIATGDELVMPGDSPGPNQIICSNSFAVKVMLEAAGAKARLLPIARDTPASLRTTFELAQPCDLIVTFGGASVGDFDIVRDTALGEGLDLDFYKIAMRPGKPLLAGRLGPTPLVGLPGNPVSAIVCAHVFLLPAIDKLLGLPARQLEFQPARLTRDLGANGPRAHFMRAEVAGTPGAWTCTPFERQDSALLSVLTSANALMHRPPHDPPRTRGNSVDFLWL